MRSKTKEGLELIALLGVASLAAVLPLSQGASLPWKTQPAEEGPEAPIERGARAFGIYCASCHGTSAEGNGPLSDTLKVHPADLTRITQRNDGTFPERRVASVIDGRLATRGHGPGSMPVWGLSFQVSGKDIDQEREVREKIGDLVAYLESIQK